MATRVVPRITEPRCLNIKFRLPTLDLDVPLPTPVLRFGGIVEADRTSAANEGEMGITDGIITIRDKATICKMVRNLFLLERNKSDLYRVKPCTVYGLVL